MGDFVISGSFGAFSVPGVDGFGGPAAHVAGHGIGFGELVAAEAGGFDADAFGDLGPGEEADHDLRLSEFADTSEGIVTMQPYRQPEQGPGGASRSDVRDGRDCDSASDHVRVIGGEVSKDLGGDLAGAVCAGAHDDHVGAGGVGGSVGVHVAFPC